MSYEPPMKILKFSHDADEDEPKISDASQPIEIDELNCAIGMPDLLSVEYNEKVVTDLTKLSINQLQKDYKTCYKIIKIKIDDDYDEVSVKLSNLSPEKNPFIFVFIIDVNNVNFPDKISREFQPIVNHMQNFNRPLLLQITSKINNTTKIYYKNINSKEFKCIDQEQSAVNGFNNISTFLKIFMNHKNENFDSDMINKILVAHNSSLILRLFRTLELSEEFWEGVTLKCSEIGTKDQLLAAMDAPFVDGCHVSNLSAQNLLTRLFIFDDEPEINSYFDKESSEKSNEKSVETKSNDVTKSILSVAVKYSNKEIVNFLIGNFSHLIQELQHDHKIDISTAAFHTDQIDILCDLLQYADFPFPKSFKSESITHVNLQKIMSERENFHKAIKENDFKAIKKFVDDNSNLKLVFNVQNETAMSKALNSKSFEILLHLKTFGFEGVEFKKFQDKLKDDEKEQIDKLIEDQVQQNVNKALQNDHVSVTILINKSRIHNIRKYDKDTQLEQRKQIDKWFNDINKTESGKDMNNVAAQCEHLKFVFDFESKVVVNMDLESTDSSGFTQPDKRWIFIGAKISDENCEQRIKGVLAHELSHYTMRKVYENNEKPYHKKDAKTCELFDDITNGINVWTEYDSDGNKIFKADQIDDECDGIISSVFTLYEKDDHHIELIVRVQHILAQFDNDPHKVEYLKEKYKPLFDFHEHYIMPEMKKFNSKKRKFNKLFGFLPQIENFDLKFDNPKHLTQLNSKEVVIAVSNVPQLLFHDIYNQACAQKNLNPFVDDKIVFIKSKKLNNPAVANEYLNIQIENTDMKIYVDCSKEFGTSLGDLFVNQSQKFIFVVQAESQCKSLTKALETSGKKTRKSEINYEFNDLSLESRKKFLPFIVTFQNSRKPLFRIILNKLKDGSSKEEQEIKAANDLVEVVNDQMLNYLMEDTKFSINSAFFEELSNDYPFIILFLPRKFIKIFGEESIKAKDTICHKQLAADTRTQKYVIISDIAGTGKSWAMKSIAKFLQQKFGTCWVAYVDLKQFTKAFDDLKDKPDFMIFMIDHVLKGHQKFETKIFAKLYEKGKIFVLFDGFDEISPKYNKTVVSIIKSFESHGGNQMWIATRDHFAVDLQKELEVDFAYKLDEFTEENGIDMIAATWVLNELKSDKVLEISKNAADLKNCLNFKSHREVAQTLVKKISNLKLSSIGFPQFYKMIAEVFMDNKVVDINLNNFKIYNEFTQIQIRKWSTNEGKLRNEKNAESQRGILSFTEVHQFLAMKSFFTDEDEFCELELDKDDWSDEEVMGCGLVTKNGETFLFSHETFREFFAADFILSNIKKGGSKKLMEFFIKFLTVQKYDVIRMFINDALADEAVLKKIDSKIQKLSKNFDKSLDGSEIVFAKIDENRSNLITFLIKLLENLQHEKVKNILDKNNEFILQKSVSMENILKVQKWFIEVLKVDELGEFILRHDVLSKYLINCRHTNVYKDFISRIDDKIGKNFMRKLLRSKNSFGRNIFLQMCSNKLFNKIMFECLIDEELFELLENCDNEGLNILHVCVESNTEEVLKFVWKKIETFFKSQNLWQNFKKLLGQKCQTNEWNVLNHTINSVEIPYHKTFWNLLLKTFENQEELKELTLAVDKDGNNFIHNLVRFSIPDVIEISLEIIRKNFSDAQFQEILNSKGYKKVNLLQTAVQYSQDIYVHRFLWKLFKDSCKSDEKFIEIIKYVDEYKWNMFHYVTAFSTKDILDLFINETEKVASPDVIKTMFSSMVFRNRNILRIAAELNKSSEFHQSLWKILNKYLKPSELLSFVKCLTFGESNLLELALDENTQEVVELTWTKIKELFEKFELIKNKLKDEISQCDLIMENVRESGEFDKNSTAIFLQKWNEIIEFLNKNFIFDVFQETMQRNIEDVRPEIVKNLVHCKDIKLYEEAWDQFHKNYKDRDELKTLILNERYMYHLVNFGDPEIIKFTLSKFEKIFSEPQFKEILKCRDFYQRNLFQELIFQQMNFAQFRSILSIFRTYHNNASTRLEHPLKFNILTDIFEEFDKNKCNIFHTAAEKSTNEIFDFLIEELEKVETEQRIKELLSKLNISNENLLQIAAKANKRVELHQSLWKVIRKYFKSQQILDLVSDKNGQNLIFTTIRFSHVDILKFTWTEIENTVTVNQIIGVVEHCDKMSKNILHTCVESNDVGKLEFVWKKLENSSKQFSNLLKQKCMPFDENVLHLVAKCEEIKVHETFWKLLLEMLKDSNGLTELILQKDIHGNNFIHHLVRFRTAHIIENTFEIIEKNLSMTQFHEILMSKGYENRNLLQNALIFSKNIEVYRILWKTLRDSCKSDTIFVEIIKDVSILKSNLFHFAVQNSTSEILEFMVEETEKVESREEIKFMLISLNRMNFNLLHYAACNESIALNESLWMILQKYFNPQEILDFINQIDNDGETPFMTAARFSTKEIIEYMWTKIQSFLHENDQVEYLKKREKNGNGLVELSLENSINPEVQNFLKKLLSDNAMNMDSA